MLNRALPLRKAPMPQSVADSAAASAAQRSFVMRFTERFEGLAPGTPAGALSGG